MKYLLLIILLIVICVSCSNTKDLDETSNKQDEAHNLLRENYYEDISEDSRIYGEGFSHSCIYNISTDYAITVELVIYKEKEKYDSIQITLDKKDIGGVDGSFGLLAERQCENKCNIWTLRNDEITKSIKTPDILGEYIRYHSELSGGGMIKKNGDRILMEEYITDTDNDSKCNWKMSFYVYGISK